MCMTVRYSQPPGVAVETDSNSVCEALSPEQELRTCWDSGTLRGRFASTSGLHFLICNVGETLTARPNHGSLNQQQRGSHCLMRPSQTGRSWPVFRNKTLFLARCQSKPNSALFYVIPEMLPSLPLIFNGSQFLSFDPHTYG